MPRDFLSWDILPLPRKNRSLLFRYRTIRVRYRENFSGYAQRASSPTSQTVNTATQPHHLVHRMEMSVVASLLGEFLPLYSFNAYHPLLPARPANNCDDWAGLIFGLSNLRKAKECTLTCDESQ